MSLNQKKYCIADRVSCIQPKANMAVSLLSPESGHMPRGSLHIHPKHRHFCADLAWVSRTVSISVFITFLSNCTQMSWKPAIRLGTHFSLYSHCPIVAPPAAQMTWQTLWILHPQHLPSFSSGKADAMFLIRQLAQSRQAAPNAQHPVLVPWPACNRHSYHLDIGFALSSCFWICPSPPIKNRDTLFWFDFILQQQKMVEASQNRRLHKQKRTHSLPNLTRKSRVNEDKVHTTV